MRIVGALSGLLFLGLLAGACSSGGVTTASDTSADDGVKSTSEAITNACDINTIGFPCDPDGPTHPLTECQGVCAIVQSGSAACVGLAEASLPNLDGRVCGNAGGVGNAACARHCLGTSCLVTPASAGAACRPNSKSAPCDGQCDGSGTCTPIAKPCDFGRVGQQCTFDTCNLLNATSCRTQALFPRTLCATGNVCELGFCSGFACTSGGNTGCNDGNTCTDDSCDPQTGACVATPNDNNTCSDGNACTVGDFCAGGACKAGATAPSCDDGDPCTVDSCDPKTGCVHSPKCSDGNACTVDTCDSSNGKCGTSVPAICDDGNPCTVDSCNTQSGCQHIQKNCDDGNACTTDTCSDGECRHSGTICADSDPCTTDACIIPFGCVFAPITNCTPEGGAGGTGGMGGTGGTGGGAEAGAPSGGTDAVAGMAGSPDTVDAGENAGAPSEVGDSGPSAGAPGVDGDAGTGNTAGRGGSTDTGGCGCRTAAGSDSRRQSAALAIAALGLAWLRRRRSRRAA